MQPRTILAVVRVLIAIALLVALARASDPAHQTDACGNEPIVDSHQETPIQKAEREKWMGQVRFTQIRIVGTRLPAAELQQIRAELAKAHYAGIESLDEIQERARDRFQSLGYFKVWINPEFKIISGGKCFHDASAKFSVDQGPRYNLGKIVFSHADLPSGELRVLFPINDGSVFDTSKVRIGLDDLRKAYGRRGYINFTAVPDTKIHESEASIDLNIDIDAGKQFHVRQIGVAGLTDDRFQQFYALFPLKEGAVFDSEAFERFFHEHPEFAPPDFAIETDTITKQDPIAATVDLRIDLSGHHIKWPDMN
jgi:hypothetical protein